MTVTINARGTSHTRFQIGKTGPSIDAQGVVKAASGGSVEIQTDYGTAMTVGSDGSIDLSTPALNINGKLWPDSAGVNTRVLVADSQGDLAWGDIKTVNGSALLGSGDILVGDVTLNGVQTLTNKTIDGCILTGGYTEETFSPAEGSTFTFDFANGTIQSYTTDANTTISLPAPAVGKSFQIQVVFGGTHTLTFDGGALSWGDDTPTFSSTAGKTDIVNFTCNVAGTKWFGSLFGTGYE